jgi:TPR repeat protein
LPELKDPVEHKNKAPLILLLLLVLACAAGGVYWWKFMAPADAPPAAQASAQQAAPAPAPPADNAPPVQQAAPPPQQAAPTPKDLPPLQRARELLRAGIPPEQAVTLAKDMQSPEGADGAFLLLEDAAQKGSPEAMLDLARFYDPVDAAPKGSILPDPAQAREWYGKARDKGQGAAEDKLKALRAWAEAEKDKNPQARKLLESWQ